MPWYLSMAMQVMVRMQVTMAVVCTKGTVLQTRTPAGKLEGWRKEVVSSSWDSQARLFQFTWLLLFDREQRKSCRFSFDVTSPISLVILIFSLHYISDPLISYTSTRSLRSSEQGRGLAVLWNSCLPPGDQLSEPSWLSHITVLDQMSASGAE